MSKEDSKLIQLWLFGKSSQTCWDRNDVYFHELKGGYCPNPLCGEKKSVNIIDLGRGARECRICGTYYFYEETGKK